MSNLTPHLKKLNDQFTGNPTPQNARQILEEYFSYTDPAAAQQQLWELTHGTITNDQLDAQTGSQRSDYLYFYECCSMFIAAVHYLYSKPQ